MRIASLAPSATTMLQELGAADQIVACTQVCPLPEAFKKNHAIGSFSVLNEEKLAAAKPDLVITATLVQNSGQARLTAAGYNVLHLDPRRLTDIADTYAQLGERVDREREGETSQKNFLEELQRLEQEAYSLQPMAYSPKIYMEEWHEPPYVSGNWVPDMVRLAGGEPVLSTSGEPSRLITLLELTAADPDCIIQHVCLPPGRDWTLHRRHLRQQLANRPGWQHLRAVQNNTVYSLDDSPFNMPTRGVLGGVKILRAVLEGMKIGVA